VRSTFHDASLQEAFSTDGYVKIPFLTEAEVAELSGIYRGLHQESGFGFQPSFFSSDRDYRVQGDLAIRRICQAACDRYFDRHDAFLGCFVVKEAGPGSEVGVHQDWTFVDEGAYASLNVWFPLTDTDDQNGTLCVLPGSHRLVDTLRGSPQLPSPYSGLEPTIASDYATMVPVKAGEGIAYHHGLLHWSAVNRSAAPRVAVTVSLVPEEATLMHFFRHPDGRIERYKADNAFFTSFVMGDEPRGVPSLGFVDYSPQPVTTAQLDTAHARAE